MEGQTEQTAYRGRFKAGHDPRRHEFTHSECVRGGIEGYKAATESLLRRFPGCDPHFLMCAIIGSKPWHTLPHIQHLIERDEPVRDTDLVTRFMRE